MSKWSEEFERTFGSTKKLREETEKFKKQNEEEALKIDKVLKRFKKKK